MSELYLWTKWLHIVSATILFGTGLGTAFHMWAAHRRGGPGAIAVVARNVVLADWLFTAATGVIQPLSGIALVIWGGFDPFAPWIVLSYGLYGVAAACWLRVVWIQLRVRDLAARAAAADARLPPAYHGYMRAWFWLGWPAFLGLLAIFALMVTKPALW